MKRRTAAALAAMTVFSLWLTPAGSAKAADAPASGPTSQPTATRPATPARQEITVAILDFGAKLPGAPDLGSQIGEALTAILSGEPGFRLVDRSTLARTLQEHELNLTGVVDTDQAIKVGKLVGARILVTGRAFTLGRQQIITVKLIGTETSLVDGLLVKGEEGGDLGELIVRMAEKVGQRLREAGPKLVAGVDSTADPVPALKARLAGVKRPTVAVIVTERHEASRPAPPPVDPAVETEIKLLLRDCGFEVMDVPQNELAAWARLMDKNDVSAWPRGLAKVDVVVTGQAFSEFAARIGNLVSCSARAEVNVISRKDGKIVMADRATTRAVDLSENIAGKKALQKAGREVGVHILRHFADALAPQPALPKKGR
jgi:hypothetical protein